MENNDLYHLGILKYLPKQGFLGADNSFHVGNTYFSLSDDLNALDLENMITDVNRTCLVYNKMMNTWEKMEPCGRAIGVCKTNLGIFILYSYIIIEKG